MHIVAVSSYPRSNRGGQELSLLEVCRRLNYKGHQITLLHNHNGDLLSQYQIFCQNIININSYKILRKKNVFHFLKDFLKITRLQGDLIYSNQYHDCFMGGALSVVQQIPILCHLRTPAPQVLDPNDWQLRMSLRKISRFIPVSHETKRGWVNLGFPDHKFEVVYNGTNIERFQPTANIQSLRKSWDIIENTRVISYVGRLDAIKGLESLIQAFTLVVKSGINATLLIAGRPTYQNETYVNSLKQLVQGLGVVKQVKFLGHLADTVPIYQLSDVTVLPSIYAEPFARSAIESMACGIPVIMSSIGGTTELLNSNFSSWLFEPGNHQSLADVLKPVLRWRVTQPELGQLCRDHIVNNFSITHAVDQIEQVMLNSLFKHKA